jgi:hypothetical protein
MTTQHLAAMATAFTLLQGVLLPSLVQSKPLPPSGVDVPSSSSIRRPFYLSQVVQTQPALPSFYCGSSQGVPATLAKTERGKITVIRWSSDYFSSSGWTPEARCNEVSKRFQTFSQTGALQFVTTGYMNRQPVICVAKEVNGACAGLLLTLKPHTNPVTTLRRLMNISAYGAAPLNESTSPNLYVDMNNFLLSAPVNP